MKPRYAITGIVISFCIISFSQSVSSASFSKGDKLLQTGVSLGLAGRYGRATLPPLSVSFEYGFHEYVSAGGTFAVAGSKDGMSGITLRYTYFIIATRGEFHPFNLPQFPYFTLKDKLDAYAGLLLGASIVSVKDPEVPGVNPNGSYFIWGLLVGARFYFTEHFGLYTELGYGIGILSIGLAFRF